MTRLPINIGSDINAGDGEAIRNAFGKVNAMMEEIYAILSIGGIDPVFIPDRAISNARLAQMAAGTIKVNLAGSQANPTDATLAAVGTAMGALLIGEVKDYPGPKLPPLFLWVDGSTKSRVTYAALLDALTATATGNSTSGSATITGVSVDLTGLGLEGAAIEGNGIQAGATVSSVTATTIVLSSNANATGSTGTMRIFPHGNGNGSTTFTLPDRKGITAFGRDNMGGTAASRLTTAVSGVNGVRLGASGGDQRMQQHNHPIVDPGHNHPLAGGPNANGSGTVAPGAQSGNAGAINGISSATTGITVSNAGAGSSQNIPPANVTNYIIYAGV